MKILTAQEAADLLRVHERTLRRWRQDRTGPPSYRMGGCVRYVESEVLAWLADQPGHDRARAGNDS